MLVLKRQILKQQVSALRKVSYRSVQLLKRNIKHFVFIIIVALFLFNACDEKKDSIVISFEHPETGQPFEIVHAYELYRDYFEEISKNQDKNQKELFQNIIMNPVYHACFEGGEYLHLVDSLINNPPEDESAYLNQLKKIDKNKLNELIKDALIHSSNWLQTENKNTVCVFPTGNEQTSMVTAGTGKIITYYQDYYTDNMIKSLIAHEYHHSVWTEKYFSSGNTITVLDNLIFEGKAVAFEKLVYPEGSIVPTHPYYNMTDWEKIEPDLYKVDLDRSIEIIRGGGELPYAYGYSVGNRIVELYLEENPNLTPADLLGIRADVIYEAIEFPTPF